MNLTNLWNWFYTSSEDPTKTSKTALGLITVLGAFLAHWLTSHGVATSDTDTVAWLTQIVEAGGMILTIIGLVHKATNGIDKQIP